MASSLRKAIIRLQLYAEYLSGNVGVEQKFSDEQRVQFTNGTGSSQFNKVYTTTLTIAASGNGTVTLSSLTDAFGNALNLTKMNGLLIRHLSTSAASSVTIGTGTTPLFGTQIAALPLVKGDAFAYESLAGYTVTAASADKIKVINLDGANSATVTVTIFGSQ